MLLIFREVKFLHKHLLISGSPSLDEVNAREESSIHLTDIDKYSQMIPSEENLTTAVSNEVESSDYD